MTARRLIPAKDFALASGINHNAVLAYFRSGALAGRKYNRSVHIFEDQLAITDTPTHCTVTLYDVPIHAADALAAAYPAPALRAVGS